MTIPCTLPSSGNYFAEPSEQHFDEWPVQYTPLVYINCATLLKFCQRKSSDLANQSTKSSTNPLTSTTTSPLTWSTNSHSPQNGFNNPTPSLDQPHVSLLVIASFTLQDDSTSQEKSGVVIPITILSQNGHIPCTALIYTGSPVTLLSEKLQRQLNLPAMPLNSHYQIVGATGLSRSKRNHLLQLHITSPGKNCWP